MTTTHTIRLDQCKPGLVHVLAHGEIPGGLAMKLPNGAVASTDFGYDAWIINSAETPEYEGVPMTAVPTEVLDEIKRATDTELRAAASRAAAFMKGGRA